MRLVNYGVDSAFRAGILFDHLVVDADAAAQAAGLVGIDTQARWTSLRQFFALDIDGLRRLDTAARALVAEQTMSEHVRLLTDVRLGPPILDPEKISWRGRPPSVDPIGAVVEHFADLLRIDHEASYQPQDWTKNPTWINRWGSPPLTDFIEEGVHLFLPQQAPA